MIDSPAHLNRLPTPGRRFSFALPITAGLLVASLAGCATLPEARPRTVGVTRVPLSRPKPDLSRPVAQPIQPLERTNSRMTIALRPLGAVPFDGITLPLTSPNGRFVAAQHGPTPAWDVLLAAPTPEGAAVPVQLAIAGFEILPPDRVRTGEAAIRPLEWARPSEPRLLIGRSCNDRGFLVESPRPGSGSRWIGLVSWLTGEVEWLVSPEDPAVPPSGVACFGTFGPGGELAFCRAPAPGAAFDLVVRADPSSAVSEVVLHPEAGSTLACPLFSADRGRLYVFSISGVPDAKLALLAVNLPADSKGVPKVVARIELNTPASIATAYQSSLPLQTPWPIAETSAASAVPEGLAFVSPETASMQWFDVPRARSIPLAKGTLAGVPVVSSGAATPGCSGLFLGAARELVFQSLTSGEPPEFGADAAVVPGAFLPRLTTARRQDAPIYLLLTPPMPSAAAEVGLSELLPVPRP